MVEIKGKPRTFHKISFTHTFQGQVTNYGAVQFFFKENIFGKNFSRRTFFSSNFFKENILETNPIVPVQRTVKETAMVFFLCCS